MTTSTDIRTNLKGLPELTDGRTYFTECGYSQKYPWVEIRRTEKTVTLAKVNIKPDPDWKPEMHAGGFSAHCSNQSDQTWLYAGVDESNTRVVRMTKRGWASQGTRFLEHQAIEFYDYGF